MEINSDASVPGAAPQCGRTCSTTAPSRCDLLLGRVEDDGTQFDAQIMHRDKEWFDGFRVVSKMGGGKSGAIVYRVTATRQEHAGRTMSMKIYLDAFNEVNTINSRRPFREIDTQCRLSGRDGYNCLLEVCTLRFGDIKETLFFDPDSETRSTGPQHACPLDGKYGTADSGGAEGIKPHARHAGCTDGTMHKLLLDTLPYVPRRPDQHVLVMLSDWTPGQQLSSLNMLGLSRGMLAGTLMQLVAVWQESHAVFDKSDAFAHWDLHPDNIFVNTDRSCKPRRTVRINAQALHATILTTAQGIVASITLPAGISEGLASRFRREVLPRLSMVLDDVLVEYFGTHLAAAREALSLIRVRELLELEKKLGEAEADLLDRVDQLLPKKDLATLEMLLSGEVELTSDVLQGATANRANHSSR